MRAAKLRTELKGSPLLSALIGEGFSFVDVQPIVDLTAIRDTRFEERTSLDIELNIAEGSLTATEQPAAEDLGKAGTPHFFNVDAINSIQVTGEVLEDDGDSISVPIPINDPPYPPNP